MVFFDLNFNSSKRHTSESLRKEMAHELREDCFCAVNGFSAGIRLLSMRRALSRRVQGEELFLLGSVSLYGLCPAYIQGKLTRHRSLSTCIQAKTLPYGDTRKGFPQYAGQCQPDQRLAYLRGFCSNPDHKSPKTIHSRFLWIKQHLRIKAFYGTTENAVKTQVWIAISVYVLVAIVKKLLRLDQSLYTILQILSVTLFEKTPILQAFSLTEYEKRKGDMPNQLSLFD